MKINIISVKQLRENFTEVKEGVEQGKNYLLIYRSLPLAEIIPVRKQRFKADTKAKRSIDRKMKKVEKLAGGLKLGKSLTPVKINQLLNKRYEKMLS